MDEMQPASGQLRHPLLWEAVTTEDGDNWTIGVPGHDDSATNPADGRPCVRTVPHDGGPGAVATEHRSESEYANGCGFNYWHDGWAAVHVRYARANAPEDWRDR